MLNFDIFELLAFGWPGTTEMLILAGVLLVLFGGAKLPGLMRNLGRSVNEFKAGIKEKPQDAPRVEDDSESRTSENHDETPVNH